MNSLFRWTVPSCSPNQTDLPQLDLALYVELLAEQNKKVQKLLSNSGRTVTISLCDDLLLFGDAPNIGEIMDLCFDFPRAQLIAEYREADFSTVSLLHVLTDRVSDAQLDHFGALKFISIIVQNDDDIVAYLLSRMQTNFDVLLLLLYMMTQIKYYGIR